jgi:hypothetical protein
MPLPKPDPDDVLPDSLQELARQMRANYNESAGQWWVASGTPTAIDAMGEEIRQRREDGGDCSDDESQDEDGDDNSHSSDDGDDL